MLSKEEIATWFQQLQDQICGALEQADGEARFREDKWSREGGGGGRSRTLAGGRIIEKGGVGFSAVHGPTPAKILEALKLPEADFFATGVSIVIHPHNPMVPIIHMNVRYFEMTNGTCWFGGGIDLTPHYVVEEDAQWFHANLKAVCDAHAPADYAKYKAWADDYFYIKHRQETRGMGGIFFDHLMPGAYTKEQLFAFVQAVGSQFAPIYTHFMAKNHSLPYTEANKAWQYLRRGRYVEFNLVLDKGTKFGLDTNGRTESILMSLPPHASWEYDHQPGPEEAATLAWLRKGVEWA